MAFTKKPPAAEGDGEDWMATYADAITLLLCFFVILLSISEPKQKKFEEMKEGFMQEFTAESVATPTVDMFEQLQQVVEASAMERDTAVEETDSGMRLELDSSSFFEPASANLTSAARSVLKDISDALMAYGYDEFMIEVEGHTDNVAINTPMFPSNWELSAARATAVIRFFESKGLKSSQMKATGYADTVPKMPNTDIYGKAIPENQALNRRVVINLERIY